MSNPINLPHKNRQFYRLNVFLKSNFWFRLLLLVGRGVIVRIGDVARIRVLDERGDRLLRLCRLFKRFHLLSGLLFFSRRVFNCPQDSIKVRSKRIVNFSIEVIFLLQISTKLIAEPKKQNKIFILYLKYVFKSTNKVKWRASITVNGNVQLDQ